MAIRKGTARWEGGLKDGKGNVQTETGVLNAPYSFTSRFEEGRGTNPEELVASAHSACFSMALSAKLEKAGYPPKSVLTEDKVFIEKVADAWTITKIEITTEAVVPGIDDKTFKTVAEDAKNTCPVSRALASTKMQLHAALKKG